MTIHSTSVNKKLISHIFRISVLFIIFSVSSFAQTRELVYFKKAEELYHSGNYFLAAKYYEYFLGYNEFITEQVKNRAYISKIIRGNGGSGNPKDLALYHLAESYHKLPNYDLAELYSNKAVKTLSPTIYPLAAYWYAYALKVNGKIDESEKQFLQFIKTYSRKDSYLANAQLEIKSINFIKTQQQISEKPIVINKVPVNAESSYGLVKGAGKIDYLFTSTVKEETDKNNVKYQTNIYHGVMDSENLKDIRPLFMDQVEGQYGEAVLSKDSSYLFFTGIKEVSGIMKSAIYKSKREGDKWSNPVLLGGNVNVSGYNSRQPMFTADGEYLFFSSDRPGGQGKYDIWFVTMDAGYNPGKPVNAGKTINTPEDESTPFYHKKSKSLFYSSKGKIGMGGFDIYRAEGEIGKWTESVNLGILYNSVRDDLYFFSNYDTDYRETAYFSSDRNTSCCLELFKASGIVETSPQIFKEEKVSDNRIDSLVINFEFDKSTLDTISLNKLNMVAEKLLDTSYIIKISGFTDGFGTVDYNRSLAKRRIERCMDVLKQKGIKEERMTIYVGASCCPVKKETFEDNTDNPEARKANRRVVIEFLR